MAIALAILLVALFWVAAVVFPKDSRDGRDWLSRGGVEDRPPRLGD